MRQDDWVHFLLKTYRTYRTCRNTPEIHLVKIFLVETVILNYFLLKCERYAFNLNTLSACIHVKNGKEKCVQLYELIICVTHNFLVEQLD